MGSVNPVRVYKVQSTKDDIPAQLLKRFRLGGNAHYDFMRGAENVKQASQECSRNKE